MGLKLDEMAVVLDSDDAEALAKFYAELLGWSIVPHTPGDEWVVVYGDKPGLPALVFQQVDGYVRPVWPWADGAQQQMMHLDFYVEDKDEGIAHAIACGAHVAEGQAEEFWTVMIDPAGHPFCILPKRAR